MSSPPYSLAIDAGNTTIEWGLFSHQNLRFTFTLSSSTPRLADEFWQSLRFFLSESGVAAEEIGEVGISSVVPQHTRPLLQMAQRLVPQPVIISHKTYPYLVKLPDPTSVGSDRLAGALAGYHRLGGPLLVVDFGTATTLDLVSREGEYLGGVITPGPLTLAHSLHRRTAQLPEVELTFPSSVLGTSTDHAIRSGITYGVVEMVDGLIDRVEKEVGEELKVIATGGLGEPYSARSRRFFQWVPHLVLEGINLMIHHTRTHSL